MVIGTSYYRPLKIFSKNNTKKKNVKAVISINFQLRKFI